jgi:hypothetical protein
MGPIELHCECAGNPVTVIEINAKSNTRVKIPIRKIESKWIRNPFMQAKNSLYSYEEYTNKAAIPHIRLLNAKKADRNTGQPSKYTLPLAANPHGSPPGLVRLLVTSF